MILREATILYKGYDPNKLSHGSAKRICASCDNCGIIRYIEFRAYRNLCNSCSHIGIKRSDKFKLNRTGNKNPMFGIRKFGSNNPNYRNHKLSGKNNPNYGNHLSDEIKDKISKGNIGKHHSEETKRKMCESKLGSNNPNWKGGLPIRDHVLPERDCIKFNERFNNSEFHHLSRSYGVYISKELHTHLYHNMKSGQGMNELSILSFQFIKGEL